MGLFDGMQSGGGTADAPASKKEEVTFIVVGGALAIGAFLFLNVIRGARQGGSQANANVSDSLGNPAGTVYVPTSGPTDISEVYNYQSGNTTVAPLPPIVIPPVPGPTGPAGPAGPPGPIGPTGPAQPVPPPPVPVQPPVAQKWWVPYLSGSRYLARGESVAGMARFFDLRYGWTDIAYNPNNAGLENGQFLHNAYTTQGAHVVPAGTPVWIPTTRINPASTGPNQA